MSQTIPAGYRVLRMPGKDLFTFARGTSLPGAVWLSKRDTLDAIWQDFRARATAVAHAAGVIS
jgi:hypothetical protein